MGWQRAGWRREQRRVTGESASRGVEVLAGERRAPTSAQVPARSSCGPCCWSRGVRMRVPVSTVHLSGWQRLTGWAAGWLGEPPWLETQLVRELESRCRRQLCARRSTASPRETRIRDRRHVISDPDLGLSAGDPARSAPGSGLAGRRRTALLITIPICDTGTPARTGFC